jgi:hypothetical protein
LNNVADKLILVKAIPLFLGKVRRNHDKVK